MSDELVTVATFGDVVEANIARSRLEASGIEAVLADDRLVGVMPLLTGAIGGIRLRVRESDAEKAISALDTGESEDEAPEVQGAALPPEDPAEPLSIREKKADRALKGAVLGLLFLPLQLYVLSLLVDIFYLSSERLRPDKRRRARIAALINIPVVVGFFFFFRWIARPH
jgi:hypothetical protein